MVFVVVKTASNLLYIVKCMDDAIIDFSHAYFCQMIMLEGAKATTETVDALRTGASAMKAMQKATYVTVSFYLAYFCT